MSDHQKPQGRIMDYKTFSHAFTHNCRSAEHIINLVKNRVDRSSSFALFLGAGASMSSGVKGASEMIKDWKKKLYASANSSKTYADWERDQEWANTDDEYARLFESVYDQPEQRRTYIEKAVASAKPSWGYAYLVSLISEGFFNVVFTTNFDDLLNEACYIYSENLRPMVCAHDSAVASVRLTSDRPKVIKLHGDFLYDSIKNTSSELQSLESNMREKFTEFARELGLIVIGYSGNDQSVMDLLAILARNSSYFRSGIYWCIKKGSVPQKRLRQLLRGDRVFWLEIDGFDEFMSELAQSLNVDLPLGVIQPHLTAINRTRHLVEKKISSSSAQLTQDFNAAKELYNRVEEALEKVGLSPRPEHNPELSVQTLVGAMKNEVIPHLEIRDLMSQKQYQEAIPRLKKLLEESQAILPGEFWEMLVQSLLIQGDHDEVRRLLTKPPHETWISSKHYLVRSYYCLYICDSALALDFANRALELNSGLPPALVNRALAHFIAGNQAELANCITELSKGSFAEQYQAAAKALSGDIASMLSLLQRAFILGRYSVKDACSDVVFRTYWEVPQFVEAISDFSSKKNLEFPYLKTCPPSEKELELRARIVSAV